MPLFGILCGIQYHVICIIYKSKNILSIYLSLASLSIWWNKIQPYFFVCISTYLFIYFQKTVHSVHWYYFTWAVHQYALLSYFCYNLLSYILNISHPPMVWRQWFIFLQILITTVTENCTDMIYFSQQRWGEVLCWSPLPGGKLRHRKIKISRLTIGGCRWWCYRHFSWASHPWTPIFCWRGVGIVKGNSSGIL